MRMKESDWRYLVDALLFICLIGMAFIGILLGFVLSEGPVSAGGSKYFLGLHRHQWGNIHAYLSIAFIVLMAVHLVLSWKWIKAKTQQIFKGRATAPLVAVAILPFAALLLFWVVTPKDADLLKSYGVAAGDRAFIPREQQSRVSPSPVGDALRQDTLRPSDKPAAPAFPVVEPERHHGEEHRDRVDSVTITGRHTLRDLERETGISAREIARRMGLPELTPVDESLGRLRRLHGFEIDDVRHVVSRLLEERGGRRD